MSFKPQHAVVWVELPVSDLPRAIAFYNTVFNYDLSVDESGPNPISFIPTADETGIAGHLYPGKPAKDGTGATLHLAVPDNLEATQSRFKDAGGTLMGDVVTIPPGRFAYGIDPDGNSIGMFEAA